jgi:hypothetical protein
MQSAVSVVQQMAAYSTCVWGGGPALATWALGWSIGLPLKGRPRESASVKYLYIQVVLPIDVPDGF